MSLLQVLFLVGVAAASPLVLQAGIGADVPSGKYVGSKSVLGEKVDATINFESSSALELTIAGAISLDCTEDYTYSAPNIKLTNAGTAGDCVHDELSKEHASLDSSTYDSGSDQITVVVKVSFLKVTLVLSKASDSVPITPWTRRLSLTEAAERYSSVFAVQQPEGVYTFAREGTSITATFTSSAFDMTTVVDGNSSDCLDAQYRLSGDRIMLGASHCNFNGVAAHTVTYDPFADTITVLAQVGGRQSVAELVRASAVVDSHAHSNLERLYSRYFHAFSQAVPSGSYAGSKTVLGEKVSATIKIDNSTELEIGISGVISLSCSEAYTYSSGTITLPNDGTPGDCVHDALAKNNVKLDSVKYDTSSDEITVSVKYSFLAINVVLTHTSD